MMHIIIGLFFIALGIWGIFDEWYYVIDFVKGSASIVLVLIGLIGILAGLVGSRQKPEDAPIDNRCGALSEVEEDA